MPTPYTIDSPESWVAQNTCTVLTLGAKGITHQLKRDTHTVTDRHKYRLTHKDTHTHTHIHKHTAVMHTDKTWLNFPFAN